MHLLKQYAVEHSSSDGKNMTRAVSGTHSYRSADLVRSLAALALSLCADAASAYVGPSFLQVVGIDGTWPGKDYEGWIKFEAQYWTNSQVSPYMRPGLKRTHFSGPQGYSKRTTLGRPV